LVGDKRMELSKGETSGQINEDVYVIKGETVELGGQIVGSVYVEPGGSAILRGQVTKNFFIRAGGKAIIHGQIVKNLINDGYVEIYGMIIGKFIDNSKDSLIDTKASIP
jgi:hypothetical protein